MDFEIYCDESCLEAISKKDEHLYTGIGGVWIPSDLRPILKEQIYFIKNKYNIKGELKWNKVSPKYIELYKELIDYFFNSAYLRFRVILIESSKVDNINFNNSDAELGFYKFYYQLLKGWIYDFNNYDIFLDLKKNRNKGRLKDLEQILDNANLFSDVKQVQGLPSEESLGIQLADLLTGLVTAKFNCKTESQAKLELIRYVEAYLGNEILPTPKWNEKFNIFKINLKGGW